jgi:hypothetical protein
MAAPVTFTANGVGRFVGHAGAAQAGGHAGLQVGLQRVDGRRRFGSHIGTGCPAHATTERTDGRVHGHAVVTAFGPAGGFGFEVFLLVRVGFQVGLARQLPLAVTRVVGHRQRRLPSKLLRDLHLRLHVLRHPLAVKDRCDGRFGVAGACCGVARNATDGRLSRARCTAAIAPNARTGAARTGAHAHASAARAVAGLVLNVGSGDAASAVDAVLALVNRCLGAGDGPAVEVGAAIDGDLEAAITGPNRALLGHRAVVAVDARGAGVHAAARGRAHGDAATGSALPLLVAGAVLLALDDQVATQSFTHVRGDGVGSDHRTLQGGVATAGQADGAALDVAVAVGGLLAVAVAPAGAAAQGETAGATFDVHAHADAARAAAVAAGLGAGALAGGDADAVVCIQAHRSFGAHLAALDIEVAGLSGTGGFDSDVAASLDAAALALAGLNAAVALAAAGGGVSTLS